MDPLLSEFDPFGRVSFVAYKPRGTNGEGRECARSIDPEKQKCEDHLCVKRKNSLISDVTMYSRFSCCS